MEAISKAEQEQPRALTNDLNLDHEITEDTQVSSERDSSQRVSKAAHLVCAMMLFDVPSGHSWHAVWPSRSWNLPAWQLHDSFHRELAMSDRKRKQRTAARIELASE
jgi:hypothetical protein